MSTTKKVTPERKAALTQLCDAESYVAIIRESLSEEQVKAHPPVHLANVLSLAAELYLLYYDSIGAALATASELAVTFTCKLSRDKDTVEISYLPVAKFKDSASAVVEEDDNQPDLGNIKREAKGRAPRPAKTVPRLGNAVPQNLPAPVVDAEIVEAEVVEERPALTDEAVRAFANQLEDETPIEEVPARIAAFFEEHGRDGLIRLFNYAEADDGISSTIYTEISDALSTLGKDAPEVDADPEVLV